MSLSTPMRRRGAFIAAIALLCTSSLASAQQKPPVAPVKNVTDTFFGTTVNDPYRYMEDPKNPDAVSWMKAQADYTRATLDRIPGRAELLKEVSTHGDAAAARILSPQLVGPNVYYLKRNANENIAKLYVRAAYAGQERLLFDPEAIKADPGQHYAIDWFGVSPDNKYLAYGLSVGGSEESVLHVIDLSTGKETGDVIDRTNFGSPSFLPDGRLLYNRLQKLAPGASVSNKYLSSRAYIHVLGSNPDSDTALVGADITPNLVATTMEVPVVINPYGSNYLLAVVINGVQNEQKVFVAPLASLSGAKTPWVKVADTADAVTAFDVHGDTIYLLTHKDASRFKVISTSLAKPNLTTATAIVPESKAVVTGIGVASDALYVRRMTGGISDLLFVGYARGAKPQPIKLPFAGDIDALVTDPRQPGALFDTSAWTRFGGYYAFSPRSGSVFDTKLQPQGKYDNPEGLTSVEVEVKAADGTMVPMSIVHRTGIKLDGSNPTLLYGYGAYGISQTPFYRPTFLSWFERGGVLAVAHVRGGGEMGEDWHRAGQKLTKPNTWGDAIACGDWLVAHKYTSSARMAIWGGSAGGIFVGRSITDRPELFRAAIDEVPVSDMLRFEFSANGPNNIPEFGSTTTADGFKGLLAMSPYHAVKDGTKYPAVLLITGFNDPRVDSWEPAKMTARLQAATTSNNPILLRIDYDAGHGFGSTKKSQYEERADVFAFLLWQFGVDGYRP